MVHYSVLIPQRDCSPAVAELVRTLEPALARLVLPFEILCVDDASQASHASALRSLLRLHPRLRVLGFDCRRGTSAALTAGIAAARGDLILATSCHTPQAGRWLPHLVARLSQADFVYAGQRAAWHQDLVRAGRRLFGLLSSAADLAPDEELFWAARREAVAGLSLARGAFRVLPTLVAQRGQRVCRLVLSPDRPPQGSMHRPRAPRRLLAHWRNRPFEPHLASQWPAGAVDRPTESYAHVDAASSRVVLPPVALPPAVLPLDAAERRDAD